MKTIGFLIVSSLLLTHISIAQWEPIGPCANPGINIAAVNDSIVYTFGSLGLAKKMVIGENKWSDLPNPDGGYMIEQFAARDSILFASSDHYQAPNGLFLLISTNRGVSWNTVSVDTIMPLAYSSEPFTSFEIIGSTLFAGTLGYTRESHYPDYTRGGLYISADLGRTWKMASGDSLPGGIGKLKAAGSTLYSAGKGLYKSSDLGKNWQSAGLKDSVLDMIEAKDSKILAGYRGARPWEGENTPGRVYLSVDEGSNWKTVWSADSIAPNAITIFANDLYISTSDNRILKSQDAGQTWKNVSNNCFGNGAITLLQHDSSLVAVFSDGVFVSHDGENWRSTSRWLGPAENVVAFTSIGGLYIAGSYDGIHVSNDRGETWKFFGVGTVNNFLKIGSSLLAGTSAGLLISEDTARSWRVRNSNLRQYVLSPILIDGPKIIAQGGFQGQSSNSIIASFDTGRTWSQFGSGFSTTWPVYSFAVIDSTIIADVGYDGISLSTDHGISWTSCYSSSPGAIVRVFASGNTFFAGTFKDVLRSTDKGTTWHPVYRYPFNVFPYSPRSFVQDGSNIVVGFDEGKIAYTPDGGNSWKTVESNLPDNEFDDLVISENEIFALMWSSGLWRRPLSEMTGVAEQKSEIPSQCALEQNYPNPFNPLTVISYQIAVNSYVTMKVYDLIGREVATLVNEKKEAGTYSVQWNASGCSSGIYFYRLETNGKRDIRKMVLMK